MPLPPGHKVPCEPRPGCNRYTPCGVRTAGVLEIPQTLYSDTRQNCTDNPTKPGVRPTACDHLHLPPEAVARTRLREWLSQHNVSEKQAALRITGPRGDGFWVRVIWVLAHATWAKRVGLPISVAYHSPLMDSYYAPNLPGDGFTQYFEPVEHSPPNPTFLQLDCFAAACAWEDHGNYAERFDDAVQQRAARTAMVEHLSLRPLPVLRDAAESFWSEHFARIAPGQTVLGVHLRGTDKQRWKLGLKPYADLAEAYLCAHPNATVFVATDDELLLRQFQIRLKRSGIQGSRLVWRKEVLRGNSTLNAGVHASMLGLNSRAADLGWDVMLDTLLLSRVDFLIHTTSAVAEFATILNPRLQGPNSSYNLNLAKRGQPMPVWGTAHQAPAKACGHRPPAPPSVARSADTGKVDGDFALVKQMLPKLQSRFLHKLLEAWMDEQRSNG